MHINDMLQGHITNSSQGYVVVARTGICQHRDDIQITTTTITSFKTRLMFDTS